MRIIDYERFREGLYENYSHRTSSYNEDKPRRIVATKPPCAGLRYASGESPQVGDVICRNGRDFVVVAVDGVKIRIAGDYGYTYRNAVYAECYTLKTS